VKQLVVRNFPYILPRGTDGRNFLYILIDETRKFLPIRLIGAIARILLNIRPIQNPPKKRLGQVKEPIGLKHYAHRTEKSYIQQIRRYILFHHPHQSIAPVGSAYQSFLSKRAKPR
jgi:hypothetical protein